MKAQNIEKVCNEIRFVHKSGKYWYVNLNDGKVYGYNGKVTHSFPSHGHEDVLNRMNSNDVTGLLLRLWYTAGEKEAEIPAFAEKLINTYPYFITDGIQHIHCWYNRFGAKNLMLAAEELNALGKQFTISDAGLKAQKK